VKNGEERGEGAGGGEEGGGGGRATSEMSPAGEPVTTSIATAAAEEVAAMEGELRVPRRETDCPFPRTEAPAVRRDGRASAPIDDEWPEAAAADGTAAPLLLVLLLSGRSAENDQVAVGSPRESCGRAGVKSVCGCALFPEYIPSLTFIIASVTSAVSLSSGVRFAS